MRIIAILTVLLSVHYTNAQTLSLDDILTIRMMDSTQLVVFARERGFVLKAVEMDDWRSVHKYHSTDGLISFERTFPTGKKLFPDGPNRDQRMVYYHFSEKDMAKGFQKELKARGFRFDRKDFKELGGNLFTHNLYRSEDAEIDLATQKLRGEKETYTLIYYPRIQ